MTTATDCAPSRPADRARFALVTVAILVVAAVLFIWEPTRLTGGLPCLFRAVTGLHCPGCGTLRGLHQLLHGRFLDAIDFNPLMVAFLPLLLYAYGRYALRILRGEPGPVALDSPIWAWGILAAIAVFWILRNIPLYPLTYLAP